MAHGLHHVACASLTLGADHGGALCDAAQRLTKVPAPAHKRHLEVVLVDVVDLVRGREHLGLVNVVHTEALKDLRLDEVADARLRHDGDGDGLLDGRDHGGIRHACDAAVPARRRAVWVRRLKHEWQFAHRPDCLHSIQPERGMLAIATACN